MHSYNLKDDNVCSKNMFLLIEHCLFVLEMIVENMEDNKIEPYSQAIFQNVLVVLTSNGTS